MGYNTRFKGKLDFKERLTVEAEAFLNTILGEDVRDHPEWEQQHDLTYINLEVSKDHTGIVWDLGEKTHNMQEIVRLVISIMKDKYPKFGLEGEFLARGEDKGDIRKLIVKGNQVEVLELYFKK